MFVLHLGSVRVFRLDNAQGLSGAFAGNWYVFFLPFLRFLASKSNNHDEWKEKLVHFFCFFFFAQTVPQGERAQSGEQREKKTLFAISLIQWIYRSLHTLFPISSGIHAVASPHRQNGCLCWVFPALSFVLPSEVSWYRGPVSCAFPSFRTQSITFTRPVSVCLLRSALWGVGRFRCSLCMCVTFSCLLFCCCEGFSSSVLCCNNLAAR